MKEPTIYEFHHHVKGFFVYGKNSDGGLRVIATSNLHGYWEEWQEIIVKIYGVKTDERHGYIHPADNTYWRDFLEQNGLAKPTGSTYTIRGLFSSYDVYLYEFTDKFFDEALIFAEED